jgi:hypothetical protein
MGIGDGTAEWGIEDGGRQAGLRKYIRARHYVDDAFFPRSFASVRLGVIPAFLCSRSKLLTDPG